MENIIKYDDLPVRVGQVRDFTKVQPGDVVVIPNSHDVFHRSHGVNLYNTYAVLLKNHIAHTAQDLGYTIYFQDDYASNSIKIWFSEYKK